MGHCQNFEILLKDFLSKLILKKRFGFYFIYNGDKFIAEFIKGFALPLVVF